MKVVLVILSILVLLVVGFMGYKTIKYMIDDGCTLGQGIERSWDDITNLRLSNEVRQNFASRDAEYGIQYKGLRIFE
jgi:hypothetical protein